MKPGFKAFKFQFDVLVEKILINISFPCTMSVMWKRGTNKIETQTRSPLDLSKAEAVFNEKLTMFANMYLKEGTKTLVEKKTSFTVVIITQKGNKVAGQCTLDLADLLNQQINEKAEVLKLEKCPDKNAKLAIKIKTTFHGEVKDIDAMSTLTSNNRLNDSFEGMEGIGKLDDDVQKKQPEESRSNILNKINEIHTENDNLKEKLKANADLAIEKEKEKFAKSSGKMEEELSKLKRENDELKLSTTNLQKRLTEQMEEMQKSLSQTTESEQVKLLQEYKLSMEKIKTENMNLRLQMEKSRKSKQDEEEEEDSGQAIKQLREHFEKELNHLNNRIKELEREKKGLESEKYKLSSDLELEKTTKNKDKSSSEEFLIKISSLEKKIANLEREKTEEAENLTSEKSKIENGFNNLKTELINERKLRNQEKLEFLELKQKNSQLESKLRVLENDQALEKEKGQASQVDAQKYQQQVKRNDELEQSLSKLEKEKIEYDRRASELNRNFTTSETKFKERIAALENKLSKREEELLGEIKELRAGREEQEKKTQNQLNSLKEGSERQKADLEGRIQQMLANEDRMKKLLNEKESSLKDTASKELLALQKRLGEQEQKYNDTVREYQQRVGDLQKEKEELDKKIKIYSTEMENRFKKIQGENSSVRNSLELLQKEKLSLEDKIVEGSLKVKELEEKCRVLSNSSDASSTQSNQDVKVQENYINELKAYIQQLLREKSEMQQKIQQARRTSDSPSENSEDINKELAELRDKCSKYEETNARIKTELNDARMSYSKSNSDLLNSKEKIKGLEILMKKAEQEREALHEREVIKIKGLIGDVINIALENGDSELADLITQKLISNLPR